VLPNRGLKVVELKIKIVIIGIPLVLIGIMLNNGLVSRASTLEEAKAWATTNLVDSKYASTYTSEKTLYDENGNLFIVDVPDGAVVTIHWTGELVERNDEWGKNWCFEMELISNEEVIKNEEKCVNLSRNTITGKLLNKSAR
jgi:hypothetical protein